MTTQILYIYIYIYILEVDGLVSLNCHKKCHRLGIINNRILFLTHLEARKSKIQHLMRACLLVHGWHLLAVVLLSCVEEAC
jgi:2-iminoacetate synthase ThiH